MRAALTPLHVALTLLVVAVWGTNFVVIKWGLDEFRPFTFAALRYFFSAVPFVFFLARPPVPWRWLAAYGVFLGAQFALLFYAMRSDISPGLASLVIQTQVFFTIGLSMWLFRERVSALAAAGTLVAAMGLGVIALHLDATITPKGIVLVVCGAFAWACANIVVKQAARAGVKFDMLSFVAWSSLFAVPPLVAMALVFEGFTPALASMREASVAGWAAVAWQVVGNTLFGYVAWSWLLTRYDAAAITPFALLIPVFGMGASAVVLGEPLPAWKFIAGAMVLGGILLIMQNSRFNKREEKK
jgi:O-acetylserine/cysteine efflux transporter